MNSSFTFLSSGIISIVNKLSRGIGILHFILTFIFTFVQEVKTDVKFSLCLVHASPIPVMDVVVKDNKRFG